MACALGGFNHRIQSPSAALSLQSELRPHYLLLTIVRLLLQCQPQIGSMQITRHRPFRLPSVC